MEENRRVAGVLLPWDVPYGDRMAFLLDTSHGWDVTVAVGPGRDVHRVHRVLLTMASEPLSRLFLREHVDLPDVSRDTFRAFLRYVYLNQIPEQLAGEQNFHPLLNFALQHNVTGLITRLQDAIVINRGNALRLFDLAWTRRFMELAQRCLDVIIIAAEELLNSDDITEISEGSLREIIRQDGLRVEDELQVFNTVLRWGEAVRRRRGFAAASLGETLVRLLPLVRFPCFSLRQFSEMVRDSNLLPPEDTIPVFLHFGLPHEELPVAGLRFPTRPRDYRKRIGRRNGSPDVNYNIQ